MPGMSKRLFKHRGKHHHVGTVKTPTPEAMAAFTASKGGHLHQVLGTLPTPPASVDYITPAKDALATMLGNGPDSTLPMRTDGTPVQPVGDCVIAEDLHLSASRACNAGAPWVPTTAEALAAYSAVTQFDPNAPLAADGSNPTDQGTDPLALVAWRKAGNAYPDGSTLLDAVTVDATSQSALQQAIWLGVGCFAWASLPDAWESEEDGGDVWDVAGDPNPQNGHGFGLACYDDHVELTEWGEDAPPVKMTYVAAAKYLVPSAGGGVLAFIDSNFLNSVTGKCPAGYDLSTVKAYLAQLGTSAPPPAAA